MLNALDPVIALRLIGYYESGDDYSAGYSGKNVTKYSPRPGYFGFPDWPGEQGPAGITHAAGRYQFQPETWKRYAGPLGVNDFSPDSQDKVAAALYAKEGFAPWAPYNPRLREAINQLGGGQVLREAQYESAPGKLGELVALNRMGSTSNALSVAPPKTPAPVASSSPSGSPVSEASSSPSGSPSSVASSSGTPAPVSEEPNVGSMLAMLALASAGTHQFIPVDYDPFAALPGGRPPGYTSKVGGKSS